MHFDAGRAVRRSAFADKARKRIIKIDKGYPQAVDPLAGNIRGHDIVEIRHLLRRG